MDNSAEIRETVKKMQKKIYNILCDVDDFCRENNIMYFLSGGTCLGAVRHHGFIPWDDDADIMLPRDEYERFLALFPEKFHEKYHVRALELTDQWIAQYAKVGDAKTHIKNSNIFNYDVGVGIDVFPIDGLPEKKLHRKLYYTELLILRGLSNAAIRKSFLDTERYRLIKRIVSLFSKRFGARYFTEKMDRLARRFPFSDSKYVGASLAAHYGEKETIAREQMSSAVYLKFEDRELPVPVGYDEYLRNLYDDYMTIPKDAAEKGFTHLDDWIVGFDADECQHADDLPAEDDGKN